MKRAVIFGASGTGKLLYPKIKMDFEVVYATDNDPIYYGQVMWGGVQVKDKSALNNNDYDVVVIASVSGLDEIYTQLINEFRLDNSRIIRKYSELFVSAKFQFVESFAKIVYDKGILGSVAECGVFRGEFAKEINRVFPDRALYLFDTFEGFDERDMACEQAGGYSNSEANQFSITSEEIVLSKLPHRESVVVKKGYFPDTFDLADEKFCFVNLDTDLYKPILAGLNKFWPLMTTGGAILVHDYFSALHRGVKAAVDEFSAIHGISFMPIGDYFSVAFVK